MREKEKRLKVTVRVEECEAIGLCNILTEFLKHRRGRRKELLNFIEQARNTLSDRIDELM